MKITGTVLREIESARLIELLRGYAVGERVLEARGEAVSVCPWESFAHGLSLLRS